MKIPQEIRNLIESGCPAHLVTLNRDGSPQVTLVWIGLDGDEVVAAHLPRTRESRSPLRQPQRVRWDSQSMQCFTVKLASKKVVRPNCSRSWPRFILAPE